MFTPKAVTETTPIVVAHNERALRRKRRTAKRVPRRAVRPTVTLQASSAGVAQP